LAARDQCSVDVDEIERDGGGVGVMHENTTSMVDMAHVRAAGRSYSARSPCVMVKAEADIGIS
jgi:hypothetical protein